MTWIRFKRILTKPITEMRLTRQVKQSFKFRPLKEVMLKREEFRVKYHEEIKKKDSNGELDKYQNYLDLINWIIQSREDEQS